MDYTQTLLHYILPQPHYVLQMNSQTWEGEEGEDGEKGRGGGEGGGGNVVVKGNWNEGGGKGRRRLFADYFCMCVLV